MNANYVNQGETSNIKVNIFLNGSTIFKLLDFTYKHCPGNAKEKDTNFSHRMTLFKVGFPILYIITVNV